MRSPCCALAATGHTTAPPTSVMNWRRFNRLKCIRSPWPGWQHSGLASTKLGACRSAAFQPGYLGQTRHYRGAARPSAVPEELTLLTRLLSVGHEKKFSNFGYARVPNPPANPP